MEFKKEEAMRAKEIADKRMQLKDFAGAKKLALKAQVLYPELENILQIITVCEVHCSAETNIFGNEKDWYDILKIEHTADETSIKKQYRKFALLLHPDKNKFFGASDAFKLIGDAQRVLLDSEKRRIHDAKRKASRISISNRAPQNPFSRFNFQNPQSQNHAQTAKATFWTSCPLCGIRYEFYVEVVNRRLICQQCKSNFTAYEDQSRTAPSQMNYPQPSVHRTSNVNPGSVNFNVPQPSVHRTSNVDPGSVNFNGPQPSVHRTSNVNPGSVNFNVPQPSVHKTSNVNRGSVNFNVPQPSVHKTSNVNRGSVNFNVPQPSVHKTSNVNRGSVNFNVPQPSVHKTSNVNRGSVNFKVPQPSCRGTSNVNPGGVNLKVPRPSCRGTSNVNPGGVNLKVPQPSCRGTSDVNSGGVNSKVEIDKNSASQNQTAKPGKRAKTPETIDVDDLEDSNDLSKQSFDQQSLRRSTRSKLNVSYDENKSVRDHYEENPSKKMKFSHPTEEIPQKEETSDSTSDEKDDPQFYTCPDPDFSDFDGNRKEESFAAGQLWACYDDVDAMPRFYARIAKVLSPGFKLRIMWLEAVSDEDDEDKLKWFNEDLPVACGIFKRGQYETTEDVCMFSHLVPLEKASSSKRDVYKIYPRKGETWALFKNWDIKWHSELGLDKKFEYEFVEVLSDYEENGSGVSVAPLEKVKGFICVFCRTTTTIVGESNSFQLLPKELYRFSHMVPSFQMSGEERDGVPIGSFELDPASLSTGSCQRNDS